jgi:hypothetical protein
MNVVFMTQVFTDLFIIRVYSLDPRDPRSIRCPLTPPRTQPAAGAALQNTTGAPASGFQAG